jgi:hypothetical protein
VIDRDRLASPMAKEFMHSMLRGECVCSTFGAKIVAENETQSSSSRFVIEQLLVAQE